MKKMKWIAALAAGALALLAAGCDDGMTDAALNAMLTNAAQKPVAVEGITLNTETLMLKPGATAPLEATVTPENATNKKVTWSSSDNAVATVDADGTVTAVKVGEAVITAKAGGKETTCTVTVKEILVPVQDVRLNRTSLSLTRGETRQLTATVYPSNADITTVTWQSDDEEVATVDEDGTVTAKKKGTATITATTVEGGRTATCRVTVNPKTVESLTLSAETLSLMIGATETLKAEIEPEDADFTSVTWESSDEAVATVEEDGTVTAVKAGTAVITVTIRWSDWYWEYMTATCAVTVEGVALNATSLALTVGAKGTLTATVWSENADGMSVSWSSDNKTVATVDENGTVTAVAEGTATITARAGDLTAECAVTVGSPADLGFEITNGTLTKYTGNAAMVVIPEGVTEIESNTFYGCTSLTSVEIPDSVTSIWDWAFKGCTSLEHVKYTGTLAQWCTLNKNSSIMEAETVIVDGMNLKTNTMPLTIPAGVTKIGNYTFFGCSGLTSVTIPDGVKSIGDYAFCRCTSLTDVTIPDGVTSIGSSVFYDCEKLTSVTIPDSVTSIGYDAFRTYNRLMSVTYKGTLEQWCALDGDTSLMAYAKQVTISDGTDLKSLSTLVIPEGVTKIGDGAFYGCTSLTGVKIPDGVTKIGWYAFQGCTSLTEVTIPDSVTSIMGCAFEGCRSLTEVTIPSSVTSIDWLAFDGCTSLTSVNYTGTKGEWGKISIGSDSAGLSGKTIVCTDGEVIVE